MIAARACDLASKIKIKIDETIKKRADYSMCKSGDETCNQLTLGKIYCAAQKTDLPSWVNHGRD